MVKIKQNMAKMDRVIRIFLGIGMMYAGIFEKNLINNELVAMIILITGITFIIFSFLGHCPVYNIANLSTMPKK